MSLLARVLQISSDKHLTKKSSSALTTITPVSSRTSQVSKSSSSPPQSVNQSPHSAYTLSINIESPPMVLYGAPGDCTGSIISGILKLTNEDSIELENVTLSLVQTMQYTNHSLYPTLLLCQAVRVQHTCYRLGKMGYIDGSNEFPTR